MPSSHFFITKLAWHQLNIIKICAISSATTSIASGFIFLYFYLMIHPTRVTFRHKLILQLIFFDFIKAIMILIFSSSTYNENNTLNYHAIAGIGWVVVFSIEGADIIIIVFAIHMALLIFNTNIKELWNKLLHLINLDKYRLENTITRYNLSISRNEGGLYNNKHSVLIISFLFPILVATISFYIPETYQGFIYMPFLRLWTSPWWFSWMIRHVILVGIIIIYVTIYIYVMVQYRKVSKMFKDRRNFVPFEKDETEEEGIGKSKFIDEHTMKYDEYDDVFKNTFSDSLWYGCYKCIKKAMIVPFKGGRDVNIRQSNNIQNLLYEETMETFNNRKSQITKQMNMIFIYPISFFLLWFFPFINHYQIIVQEYETMWTTVPSAIFQPLNCFIDTMVFLIREKPWILNKNDNLVIDLKKSNYENFGFRYYISFLPGYGNYQITNLNNAMVIDIHEDQKELDDKTMDLKDFLNSYPKKAYPNSRKAQDCNDDDDSIELTLMDFLKLGPSPSTTMV